MRIEVSKDALSLGTQESVPSLFYAGISDIGLSRPNNEDVWAALPELGFFALADGMGGHQAGEIAAKEAIEKLFCSFRPSEDPIAALHLAIEQANKTVFEKGRACEQLNGMGTTLCCLYWTSKAVVYAHVGDSRIYRFRNAKLEQLTEDHSLFSRLRLLGKPPSDTYPYKNVITRAIGTSRKVTPEISLTSFEPNDLFLLCSDGLSDSLTIQDMEKVIQRSDTLQNAASRLIEKAKIKGSSDNITVLLVQATKA
jgi:serine/threonine protein phosphatase PrpC